MDIGKVIKKRRKELNITQEKLAEQLKVSRSTISNWETGRNYPDIEMIVSISDNLNISLDDLLKGDTKMVEKMASDSHVRNKQSKEIKILFVSMVLIFLIGLSLLYYTQKSHYIQNKNQIQSIKKVDNKIYLDFDLPKYMSYEGYWADYIDEVGTTTYVMKIQFFYKFDLSMKNNTETTIDLNNQIAAEDKDKINKIQIVNKNDDILDEIDLNLIS